MPHLFFLQGGSQYLQDLTGYFVPPVDGNYTFYLRGDDVVTMYLSTDASPARLRLIAQCSWAIPDTDNFASFFFNGPNNNYGQGTFGQISAPIALQAGVPYFTRFFHEQGNGLDFFDTAVRISTNAPNFGSEAQRQMRSTPTELYVSALTTVVREQQVRSSGAIRTAGDARGSTIARGSETIVRFRFCCF